MNGFDGSIVQANFDREVPTIFKGKYLRKWQIHKLRAGETAHDNGLVKKYGKKFQGHMSFDAIKRKLSFRLRIRRRNSGVSKLSKKVEAL